MNAKEIAPKNKFQLFQELSCDTKTLDKTAMVNPYFQNTSVFSKIIMIIGQVGFTSQDIANTVKKSDEAKRIKWITKEDMKFKKYKVDHKLEDLPLNIEQSMESLPKAEKIVISDEELN
ncbi:hypothetical protein RclHR1_02170003 [Rhizophagus clarus]|uniref:Uncharacterized protein n=1 Tax=Rhizophagus clarus TaxID=94130 RepID=A0A2Z6QXW7_9GLOM|nr:hypothetical protein RclHR1_02170003 [Rhizophagus clarus]GES87500.1 hypothetical protein RCL_jg26390.t1 [Rhizophagus clarus]